MAGPSWSPTGREIAFTSDRSGSPQIWVMDAEGANARRLTFGGSFDTQPRWSPKGDTILFTRRTAGGFDLWAVNPDGSNARALTQGNGSNEAASWAPNGRHIVFSSNRGGRTQLYTMLIDGTEQQPLTRDRGEASSPTTAQLLTVASMAATLRERNFGYSLKNGAKAQQAEGWSSPGGMGVTTHDAQG